MFYNKFLIICTMSGMNTTTHTRFYGIPDTIKLKTGLFHVVAVRKRQGAAMKLSKRLGFGWTVMFGRFLVVKPAVIREIGHMQLFAA